MFILRALHPMHRRSSPLCLPLINVVCRKWTYCYMRCEYIVWKIYGRRSTRNNRHTRLTNGRSNKRPCKVRLQDRSVTCCLGLRDVFEWTKVSSIAFFVEHFLSKAIALLIYLVSVYRSCTKILIYRPTIRAANIKRNLLTSYNSELNVICTIHRFEQNWP